MGYLSEKVAYLKGLAEGISFDESTNEGKLLAAIIEVLDDMSVEIDDMVIIQEEMQEQLDDVDEALENLEEDYYDFIDELEELIGGLEDFDDDWDDEEEDDEFYSFECPKCGDQVAVDPTAVEDSDKYVVCPNCGEKIELEFELDDFDE